MNATTTQPFTGRELFAELSANYHAGRVQWVETTEEQYREQLEMMPPYRWVSGGFLAGEPVRHTPEGRPVFHAFTLRAGIYEACDMTEADFRRLVG